MMKKEKMKLSIIDWTCAMVERTFVYCGIAWEYGKSLKFFLLWNLFWLENWQTSFQPVIAYSTLYDNVVIIPSYQ